MLMFLALLVFFGALVIKSISGAFAIVAEPAVGVLAAPFGAAIYGPGIIFIGVIDGTTIDYECGKKEHQIKQDFFHTTFLMFLR